jgi:hypothetical protein
MAHAEFVERIRVVCRDVRHDDVRIEQLFVHGDVNVAGMLNLVRADARTRLSRRK